MHVDFIDGATDVVGASQGYIGLPLRRGVVNCTVNGPDTPCMTTAWRPTEAELALLVAGEPVLVRILGRSPPPMMVYVGEGNG